MKTTFHKRKIEQLRSRIEELERENAALAKENEADKKTLLIMQESFAEKESNVERLRTTYEELILNLKEKREQLTTALEDAANARKEYEKEMKAELDRIRKQK